MQKKFMLSQLQGPEVQSQGNNGLTLFCSCSGGVSRGCPPSFWWWVLMLLILWLQMCHFNLCILFHMVFSVFFPFLVRILPINLGTISIFQNDLTSRPLNLIKRERERPPFQIWLYSQVLNCHTFFLRKPLGSKHSYFWLQKSYLYLIIRINHLSNIKANIARRSLAPRRLEDQMADSTSSSINHYCALWEIRF